MATRLRRVDRGDERGRRLIAVASDEFLSARRNAGLSQEEVSSALGISRPQYGRIERGRPPRVSLAMLCRIAAILGLEASLKFYPVADPIRDEGHTRLLERLRARLHPSLVWQTEVPLPRPGDLRAWDAVIRGFAGPVRSHAAVGGVEAETRPTDSQALDRKLALKQRDGGTDWMLLLIADTRHNRALLQGSGSALRARFPLDGRRALELLSAGIDPGGSAIVLL